jgi:hypothetical protein
MARNRYKGNRIGGPFLALPRDVINHAAFLRLSPYAKSLLIDLGAQYKGDNNGDLSCAWKVMKPRGWRSEATLHKAKHELLRSGFIFEARKGRRPNLCGLYALTWPLLDANPKHDCTPAAFERYAFLRNEPPALVRLLPKNEGLTTPRAVRKAA